MKSLPSFGLRFSRTQKAVLCFLSLVLVLQIVDFFLLKENQEQEILIEDEVLQAEWDAAVTEKNKIIYPFNPNYISSYKAYQLDLSAEQYNAILEWRNQGYFFQTLDEFQKITQVSDAWLTRYAPFFKWPSYKTTKKHKKDALEMLGELNTATVIDLQKVTGIGKVLSQRILRYKKRLSGFASFDQLHEVYGLDSTVVDRMEAQFSLTSAVHEKIDIQTASLSELAALPYLNYQEAKQLVGLRTHNDTLGLMGAKIALKWDALKFQRLTLYLY